MPRRGVRRCPAPTNDAAAFAAHRDNRHQDTCSLTEAMNCLLRLASMRRLLSTTRVVGSRCSSVPAVIGTVMSGSTLSFPVGCSHCERKRSGLFPTDNYCFSSSERCVNWVMLRINGFRGTSNPTGTAPPARRRSLCSPAIRRSPVRALAAATHRPTSADAARRLRHRGDLPGFVTGATSQTPSLSRLPRHFRYVCGSPLQHAHHGLPPVDAPGRSASRGVRKLHA
jgi:hypothetical protein